MAAGQGAIYDTSITFPTNKSDGGQLTNTTEWVASECNAQGTFNYATRAAITGGIFHGLADQSAGLPPVSSGTVGALTTTFTSNAGKFVVSEKGAPYSWIRNVEYVNLRDPRFGAVGNGVADDTAAVNAWIAAGIDTFRTNVMRVLYVPAGQYRITATCTLISGLYGLVVEGEGVWASQFILDPIVANSDGFRINSSVNVTLANFSIFCKASNPAGNAVKFDYNPVGLASTSHKLLDFMVSSTDARSTHATSVYFSELYGNNSEVIYDNCTFWRYSTSGVQLPGSQQYGHRFSGCNIQGFWNQVAPNTGGGRYGIWSGGGIAAWAVSTPYAVGAFTIANGNSYQATTGGTSAPSGSGPSGTGSTITDGTVVWAYVRGSAQGGGSFKCIRSNVGGNASADFRFDYPTQEPVVIEDLDSEHSYQTIGTGSAPVAGNIAFPLTLSRSRINYDNGKFDTGGTINWGSPGALTVKNNYLFALGTTTPPLIRIATGTPPRAISVRENIFATLGSVNYDPINITLTSQFYRSSIDARNNTFTDGGGNTAYRDEVLNIVPGTNALAIGTAFESTTCTRLYSLNLTTLTQAATTAVIQIASTLPASITFTDFRVLLYNYVTTSTGATVSINVGTTSGGSDLLQATALGGSGAGDAVTWYGESSAQRGTGLASSGGTMPNGSTTTNVYLSVTMSTGNVGNGTVSNITRGTLNFAIETKIQPRQLT